MIGRVVEIASAEQIFRSPRHPYTMGLLSAMPGAKVARRAQLNVIPGIVPDLTDRPTGCSFRERCSRAIDTCAESDPELVRLAAGSVACHNPVPEEPRA